MGKRGFLPMTATSAAVMLAAWVETHSGMRPSTRECRNTNGLPHHQTFYRLWGSAGSFGAIIMRAEQCAKDFYAYVSVSIMTSHRDATISSLPKMRFCLGIDAKGRDCKNRFLDEGPHIRFCAKCRSDKYENMRHKNVGGIDIAVNHVELKRWGIDLRNEVEEDIDWRSGE